jgi:tetratricopeptide (TPR) repeat protein
MPLLCRLILLGIIIVLSASCSDAAGAIDVATLSSTASPSPQAALSLAHPPPPLNQPSSIATPRATLLPTRTMTATSTPAPSATASATHTAAPTQTATSTQTTTPTQSATATQTAAPTGTATANPSATPSFTPTPVKSPVPPTLTPTAIASVASENFLPAATPIDRGSSPDRVVLTGFTHDWQKLNNCGPTSMSVLLSFYGIAKPQLTIAAVLKPLGGQDKNVSPAELASYARTLGLQVFVGINGSIELTQRLLAAQFPFLAQQWMEYDGGVGHYRVVRGFDRVQQQILYNDTFLGPDIWKSNEAFLRDWAAYNNTYVIFYPAEREVVLREIIGTDWESAAMWQRLREESQRRIEAGQGNGYIWYGLGEALHHLGQDIEAITAYYQASKVGLPWRYLWYRYGFFEALNATGRYEETLAVSAPVIEAMVNGEDVRYHRGIAYKGLGQIEAARREFWLALRDNSNFAPAHAALNSLPPAEPSHSPQPASPSATPASPQAAETPAIVVTPTALRSELMPIATPDNVVASPGPEVHSLPNPPSFLLNLPLSLRGKLQQQEIEQHILASVRRLDYAPTISSDWHSAWPAFSP